MTPSYFYRRNIRLNYGFTFLQCFNLTHGFWMIYLASKGMSLVQLGILEGIFHVTSFLMETPTGAVADLFGRKASRILSRAFLIVYSLLVLFGDTYLQFQLAFVLCALGWNLESGAGEAMVYDSLKETGEESSFMKVQGRLEVVYQVAQALALLAGGWIALRNYDNLFWGHIGILGLSIVVALWFRETRIDKTDRVKLTIRASLREQYAGSFAVVRGNRRLIYLLLFINGLGVFTTTSFFYMQVYCKENGMAETGIGLLFAAAGGIGALGGIAACRVERAVGERRLLLALPFVFMLLMWGMVRFSTAVGAFLFIGFFDSLMYVVYSDYINRLIPSERRATLLSFSNMVFSFFMLVLFPGFGWIGDRFGIPTAFLAVALAATALALANLAVLRARK